MADLITDMLGLAADIQGIAIDLGVRQYRQLAVRKRITLPNKATSLTDYLLFPRPQVKTISTNYIGMPLGNNLMISQTDLQVDRVSRAYQRSFLEKGNEFYILDPIISVAENGAKYISGGTRCKLLFIEDRATLYWRLILSEYPDQSNFPTALIALNESVPV